MQAAANKIEVDFSDESFFNRAYIPLLDDYSEFLHLYGSAGSGKSRFACQKEIIESFEPVRQGRKTLCVRQFFNTLAHSVYAELKTVIAEWSFEDYFDVLKSPLQITNKLTGVTFVFVGLDDVEKVKSISGVDRILIEEATEVTSRKVLDQLRLRLRGFERVQVTLCYNPVDEFHWLNTEIHQQKPAGHKFLHSTYNDNEQLLAIDPSYAKFIESTKDTNPNYYRVYGLGLWGQVVEGLVYTDYRTGVEFPQAQIKQTVNKQGLAYGGVPYYEQGDDIHFYGLDFGFSDPTALVAGHVRDASPKKELIVKELLYQPGLDAPAMVEKFKQIGVRKDVQIIADSARPEMIESLRKAGYRIAPSEKGAGSVLTGINRVRKYSLLIAAGSKNIIREISNYQKNQIQGIWVEEPAKNQIEHLLDAMRYGIQTQDRIEFSTSSFHM